MLASVYSEGMGVMGRKRPKERSGDKRNAAAGGNLHVCRVTKRPCIISLS